MLPCLAVIELANNGTNVHNFFSTAVLFFSALLQTVAHHLEQKTHLKPEFINGARNLIACRKRAVR